MNNPQAVKLEKHLSAILLYWRQHKVPELSHYKTEERHLLYQTKSLVERLNAESDHIQPSTILQNLSTLEQVLTPHKLNKLCYPSRSNLENYFKQTENLSNQYFTTLQHHLIITYQNVVYDYEDILEEK